MKGLRGFRTGLWAGAIALCVASAGGSVAAQEPQAVLYDCDITQNATRADWISPKFAFVVKGGAVTVIDAIILSFEAGPVAAQVRQRGDRLVLHWTVQAVDSQQNRARMSYRADLDTAAKTVTVRVTPVGYPQGWSGAGTCRLRRG